MSDTHDPTPIPLNRFPILQELVAAVRQAHDAYTAVLHSTIGEDREAWWLTVAEHEDAVAAQYERIAREFPGGGEAVSAASYRERAKHSRALAVEFAGTRVTA